jgi:hypothetical protein
LLSQFGALGYRPSAWRGAWVPLMSNEVLAGVERCARRYRDFLFLPM